MLLLTLRSSIYNRKIFLNEYQKQHRDKNGYLAKITISEGRNLLNIISDS